jgi:hypothetical protein
VGLWLRQSEKFSPLILLISVEVITTQTKMLSFFFIVQRPAGDDVINDLLMFCDPSSFFREKAALMPQMAGDKTDL